MQVSEGMVLGLATRRSTRGCAGLSDAKLVRDCLKAPDAPTYLYLFTGLRDANIEELV
jgi:hypothetical protein